jgi:hypothetical protein
MNLVPGTIKVAFSTNNFTLPRCRVFNVELCSTVTATTLVLNNGTYSSYTPWTQIDTVALKSKTVNYHQGLYFPNGLFAVTDATLNYANITYETLNTEPIEEDDSTLSQLIGIGGLTFYKNYAGIADGTYAFAQRSLLNADFAMGSPTATFVSTDSSFTISGGASITSLNAEALKYAILDNRTAAEETTIIQFVPSYDNLTTTLINPRIIDTDTSKRQVYFDSAGSGYNWQPLGSASAAVSITTAYTVDAGISYVMSFAMKNSGNPNSSIHLDGAQILTSNTDITGSFSTDTYWWLGNRNAMDRPNVFVVKKVAIYNRFLTNAEITKVNTLLNG